jgi:glutamine synthetase
MNQLATRTKTLDGEEVTAIQEDLNAAGVRSVIGTTVIPSGMTLAKSVPLARLDSFHRTGMGAAPAWQVFCIDGGVAFTDAITAVGDTRLRLDLEAVRDLGAGLAWGPVDIFTQTGDPSPTCPRTLLRQIQDRLADMDLEARVGHEIEFVLVAPDGSPLEATGWVPYGPAGLLDREEFINDLLSETQSAGLSIEQIHAEFGPHQFEFSLPPREPVAAADGVVLAKLLIGRVARRYNVRASFSPIPFAGKVGNGAHQHFSITRDGEPIFADGSGPHGMTSEGESAIAGVVDGITSILGLTTSSILSAARLQPGMWSGAHACWGVENREAAVRFLQGGEGNPLGANFEVKAIDPASNVYVASAAVLALAHDGIDNSAALPQGIEDDPSKMTPEQLTDAGIRVLPDTVEAILTELDQSEQVRSLLAPEIVEATLAVRRYELANYAETSVEDLTQLFRLAWSV